MNKKGSGRMNAGSLFMHCYLSPSPVLFIFKLLGEAFEKARLGFL